MYRWEFSLEVWNANVHSEKQIRDFSLTLLHFYWYYKFRAKTLPRTLVGHVRHCLYLASASQYRQSDNRAGSLQAFLLLSILPLYSFLGRITTKVGRGRKVNINLFFSELSSDLFLVRLKTLDMWSVTSVVCPVLYAKWHLVIIKLYKCPILSSTDTE